MKQCLKCKSIKSYTEFTKQARNKDGYHTWCKTCTRAYTKKWADKNRDKVRAGINRHYQEHREEKLAWQKEYRANNKSKIARKNKAYNQRIRLEVLSYYSNGSMKCACCGEDTYEFLSIDHINGDGAKHRREMNLNGFSQYLWLRKNNYPDGFQVLCHNCNLAKGLYGHCPHQNKDQIESH